MPEIKIVDIPEKMQKYYGVGKMLHPDMERVEEAVRQIPTGKLVTIDDLAKKMAKEVGADVSCPLRTGNAIKKIADRFLSQTIDSDIPFWRVVRKDKYLVKSKNYEFVAAQLEKEGFQLGYNKKGEISVEFTADGVYQFD